MEVGGFSATCLRVTGKEEETGRERKRGKKATMREMNCELGARRNSK